MRLWWNMREAGSRSIRQRRRHTVIPYGLEPYRSFILSTNPETSSKFHYATLDGSRATTTCEVLLQTTSTANSCNDTTRRCTPSQKQLFPKIYYKCDDDPDHMKTSPSNTHPLKSGHQRAVNNSIIHKCTSCLRESNGKENPKSMSADWLRVWLIQSTAEPIVLRHSTLIAIQISLPQTELAKLRNYLTEINLVTGHRIRMLVSCPQFA